MKIRWSRLGGQLGIVYCLVGLFLVFLGWNGAATYDRLPSQFPYLISGGIAGLCLVVLGAALIVAQSHRDDRAALQQAIDELRAAVANMAAGPGPAAGGGGVTGGVGDTVLVGPSSYHRPGCRVTQGQSGLGTMTASEAAASGRAPCRVCAPEAA